MRASRYAVPLLGLTPVLLALACIQSVPPAWAEPETGQPPAAATAPSTEPTTSRDLRAVRLSSPPIIDGDLSDPVWQEAAKAEHWVDWLNGNPNIDQTLALVGYDDRNLYFAWHTHDSSFRRSCYGGTETFLILGDPNARKFQQRLVLKIVWAV